MKIYTILDHIDSGHMALPKFQRGYVLKRAQVRSLVDSHCRLHPLGGLLVCATEATTAAPRGESRTLIVVAVKSSYGVILSAWVIG